MEDTGINMTQSFKFETDSMLSLERMLLAITETCFGRDTSEYVKRNISNDRPFCWRDGASFEHEEQADGTTKMERTKPTRVWVATLSDYACDIENKEIASDTFETNEEMVKSAIDRVVSFDMSKLNEKCGDGYDSGFNCHDGSISHGYRIHWEPNGGWDKIYVSIIHAYYGK